MQQLDHDTVSIDIRATPDEVYAVVADVTRTPEFSPEVERCVWLGNATGPAVGARFEATNRVARGPSWKNRPEVIVADPGREFAFARTERLTGTVVWRYRFQPIPGGTRVTESYEVDGPADPGRLVRDRADVRPQGPPRRSAGWHAADAGDPPSGAGGRPAACRGVRAASAGAVSHTEGGGTAPHTGRPREHRAARGSLSTTRS